MNIYKDTIIYIACPANIVTGGPETLHQLGFELLKRGFNVYMYYYNANTQEIEIPQKFKKYQLNYCLSIEDYKKNILILPETATHLLYQFDETRKIIWWLSVDFYTLSFLKNRVCNFIKKHSINIFISKILIPFLCMGYIVKYGKNKKLNFKKDKNINEYFHLYNCQYAFDFLLSNGVKLSSVEYLCGPISNEYFNNNIELANKKNIILYNPKKGFEYTKKIIEHLNSIDKDLKLEFIPLCNMNSEQILYLLKESKLYIDFGFFPGPERIPREAVLCYCNILTSMRGSASNDIDIPIPNSYKVDLDIESIEDIGEKIIGMIKNYNEQVTDFDIYRQKVADQVNLFEKKINKIFYRN